MLRYGSLFSGIGGIDLGFDRAGMECAWQVEIDPFCQKVLQNHWPNVRRYSDVRECGSHNLKPVEVICGGFPCQPHSEAGHRNASDDERDLWSEYRRIICELRPRWIVVENVPGLLSSENGWFFGNILRDLAASGYDAEWQMLPAQAVGSPQARERVFVVAYSNSLRQKTNHFFSRQSAKTFLQAQQAWGQFVLCRSSRGRVFKVPNAGICGMVDGLSSGLDRFGMIGNSVVPQVAEWIGNRIVEVENTKESQ